MEYRENQKPLNIPPNSIEAEQSVLGALLLDNTLYDDVVEHICVDDFYNRHHRVIFDSITDMIRKNKPVDVVTLKQSLNDLSIDYAYIIGLVKNLPSKANCSAYAKAIKEKSILRKVISAANDIQDIAYQTKDDVNGVISECERLISNVTEQVASSKTDNSVKQIMTETLDWLDDQVKRGSEIIGLPTSIPDLDLKINGLKPSTMVILAARPGMGKTTLAMNMVEVSALNGGSPLVFSLEMPRKQLMLKMWSSLARIDIGMLQRPGEMEDTDWAKVSECMKRFNKSNLEVIDNGNMTVDMMRIETRRYQKKHGKPSLLVIDYLQLIRPTKPSGNRTEDVSQISRDLKNMAKEFDCPIVVLSQLSRDVEKRADKRPIPSDLRESGQLEQDAEEIIFIYRDEVYNRGSTFKGLAELIVAKCRMGQIGMVGSQFQGQYSKFLPLVGRDIHGELKKDNNDDDGAFV